MLPFLCFSLFSSSFTDLVIVYSKFYCVVSFPSNFLSAAPRPPPLSLAARIFGVKNFALSKGKNQAKEKKREFFGVEAEGWGWSEHTYDWARRISSVPVKVSFLGIMRNVVSKLKGKSTAKSSPQTTFNFFFSQIYHFSSLFSLHSLLFSQNPKNEQANLQFYFIYTFDIDVDSATTKEKKKTQRNISSLDGEIPMQETATHLLVVVAAWQEGRERGTTSAERGEDEHERHSKSMLCDESERQNDSNNGKYMDRLPCRITNKTSISYQRHIIPKQSNRRRMKDLQPPQIDRFSHTKRLSTLFSSRSICAVCVVRCLPTFLAESSIHTRFRHASTHTLRHALPTHSPTQ